jgi:hypothetical protein
MTNRRITKLSLAAVVALAVAVAPIAARADVVVQGNQPSAPPAAPAPAAPAPVVVPQQTVTPVEAAPSRHTTVVERENRSYMGTIFVSALAGGLVGLLVGGSLYFLADDQQHPVRIGYWAAGGVLVGTGVGLTQVLVQESRADRAMASHLPTDPAPTLRLSLFQARF